MSSGNIPLKNQPRINGKERFRQQRSENLLGEDGDATWYTGNNTEHLVESEPPFYGESNPWYATRNPINLIEGAYESRTFVPTYRDAMLAQGEQTASGMRELFTPKRDGFKSRHEHLTPNYGNSGNPGNPGRCICVGCNCTVCNASSRRGVKCTGCSCPNCNCRRKPERFTTRKREHFMEVANDNSYTTDPRFLVGTAELHFNVGSDVNDITRVYGTVDQKRYYPKLADYINYGVASVLETPK